MKYCGSVKGAFCLVTHRAYIELRNISTSPVSSPTASPHPQQASPPPGQPAGAASVSPTPPHGLDGYSPRPGRSGRSSGPHRPSAACRSRPGAQPSRPTSWQPRGVRRHQPRGTFGLCSARKTSDRRLGPGQGQALRGHIKPSNHQKKKRTRFVEFCIDQVARSTGTGGSAGRATKEHPVHASVTVTAATTWRPGPVVRRPVYAVRRRPPSTFRRHGSRSAVRVRRPRCPAPWPVHRGAADGRRS